MACSRSSPSRSRRLHFTFLIAVLASLRFLLTFSLYVACSYDSARGNLKMSTMVQLSLLKFRG